MTAMYKVPLIVVAILFCGNTFATTISYEATNISGNTWEYSYSVSNDTLTSDIEEFSIYFDLGLYENLTFTSTPVNWDPIAFDPDPFLPGDGLYDAFALASGIASGDMLSGFSVQFDFLGVGGPGSQWFEILDPFTFAVLDSGNTQLASASVPEPETLWLIGMGLMGMLLGKKCTQTNQFKQA
ncbi:PEP-CTERM sorting domain-containing protein [Pseudomonadota bacterium]